MVDQKDVYMLKKTIITKNGLPRGASIIAEFSVRHHSKQRIDLQSAYTKGLLLSQMRCLASTNYWTSQPNTCNNRDDVHRKLWYHPSALT